MLDTEEKVFSCYELELGNLLSEVLPGQAPVMEVAGDWKAAQIIHDRRVCLATNPDVRKFCVQYLR